VLDAQPLAAVWVGPAGDVACRENAGRAGFEIFIDEDAAIDPQSGLLGEIDARPHADADHDQRSVDHGAVIELHLLWFDPGHGVAEVKDHTMRFMQRTQEITEHRAERPFRRGPICGGSGFLDSGIS
jgi:hypothetical protein